MIKRIKICNGQGAVIHQFDAKEGMELDITDNDNYSFRGTGSIISIWDFKPGDKVHFFWGRNDTRLLIATIPSFQDTSVLIERE